MGKALCLALAVPVVGFLTTPPWAQGTVADASDSDGGRAHRSGSKDRKRPY